jgi:hypothetical protein
MEQLRAEVSGTSSSAVTTLAVALPITPHSNFKVAMEASIVHSGLRII